MRPDARPRADYRGRSRHWARGVYAARGGLPKNSKTNRTPLSRLIMCPKPRSARYRRPHRQDSRPARYGGRVFISCRPSNRQLIHGLGDSVKIDAQMLKVHAYEYSAWASTFSIRYIRSTLSAHAGRARARFGIADGPVWPRRRSRSARKRDCQRIWRGTCRSGFARQ